MRVCRSSAWPMVACCFPAVVSLREIKPHFEVPEIFAEPVLVVEELPKQNRPTEAKGACGRRRWGSLHVNWCVGVLWILLSQGLQASEAPHAYASQPLASALEEFARSTGLQLVYRTELTEGLVSKGASVQLTSAATLKELLRDTGLGFEFINDQAVTIVRVRAAQDPARPLDYQRASSPEVAVSVSGGSNSQNTTTGTSTMNRSLLARLAGIFAASAVSWTAHAQDAGPKVQTLEEVVVTGSRVIQNGNDSPTPLTVVSTDDLKSFHPTNIAEAMADLPVFSANFRGQQQNAGAGGPQNAPAGAQSGANVLNLRSMGPLRTLILFDGHRAPPNTPDGYVDADTIPSALLKRVDIVTGGASAVYGSDAISGVVNFITDTKFQGIKATLQSGISAYNDDRTVEGSLAFGTSLFDGRGHVMGSYTNRHDAGIDSGTARPFRREQRVLGGIGTAASPKVLYHDARNGSRTDGGLIRSGFFNGQQFTSGGYIIPFVHGVLIDAGNTEIGGDGQRNDSAQIRAGLDQNQFYGRFDFDLPDTVHGYFMASDALNDSVATNGYFGNQSTLSRDNAYLLPQYRNQLITSSQTTFTFSKNYTGFPRNQIDTRSNEFVWNAGLQGELGVYKWDVSYFKGDSSFDVRNRSAANQGRLAAALDSVPSGGWVNGLPVGTPVCRAALTNAAYADCVPLDPFGVNSESQAAANYIFGPTKYLTKIGSDDVTANLTGAPFSDWAGPINAALSAEWRKLTYQIDSNSQPTMHPDCTGITLNCTGSTVLYNASTAVVPKVSRTVKEAAIELGIPLLKDKSWAQSVDLQAAYRLANYEVTGNAKTWKAGLTWDINGDVTLRATRSRDFRAPSLDEMFRAISVSFTNFNDLMPGSQNPTPTQVRTESGGNPDLNPETADTLTYGVVYRPTANFSISVDAFDIKVKNAIFQTQGNDSVVQSVCYASGGASPYCSLIGRALGSYTDTSAANSVVLWRQVFINAANHNTQGADVEANFRTSIASRPLNLRLLTTYQPHVIFERAGVPTLDFAGTYGGSGGFIASPVWRATAFAEFKPTDSISIGVQERWRSGLKYTPETQIVVASPDIKSIAYTNLNFTYTPTIGTGRLDLFFNVANVFNTDPSQAAFYLNPNPAGGDVVAGDDVIGRYYTAGLRFKL
jgi:iron complex outermembrane recepter protein